MAKTNLLKTSDLSFLELVGNGKRYRVPPFQRDYSWTEEQWEDLWNDLVDVSGSPDARHYMGSLVVEASSDRDFHVIDGQQRLATLSLLVLAVIHTLERLGGDDRERAENADRARHLRNRFIGEKEPASLIESSKLFLNETDDPFYQDTLVQLRPPLNPRGLPRSSRLLWECFEWFKRRVESRSNQGGEALTSLISEALGRRFLFILITVEDELSAYVVFETLNARGLELSATDLLKNYLFSLVPVASDRDYLGHRWKSLVGTDRQERFPDFLRYHLLCTAPQARKQRLFKEVRATVRDSRDVFRLMEELEKRAELFSAINDFQHEYWQEDPEARRLIRELLLFRVSQTTPLLFAAFERMPFPDFVRVLRFFVVISFRYTIIGELNTNLLEPVYHRASKALLDQIIRTPSQVFETVKEIYVPDDKFKKDFETAEFESDGRRRKILKHILCTLETEASGSLHDYETDPGTIEHILPENPGPEWEESFPSSRQELFVSRLGNLTLIEGALNRDLRNGSYSAKIARYRGSRYRLTRRIAEVFPGNWSPESLALRQKRMAKRAVHLRRADFHELSS